jgi:hypothetical protein
MKPFTEWSGFWFFYDEDFILPDECAMAHFVDKSQSFKK